MSNTNRFLLPRQSEWAAIEQPVGGDSARPMLDSIQQFSGRGGYRPKGASDRIVKPTRGYSR